MVEPEELWNIVIIDNDDMRTRSYFNMKTQQVLLSMSYELMDYNPQACEGFVDRLLDEGRVHDG